METKELRFFSHSRTEKDHFCERAGYYSREWGGTGIVPIHVGWDLIFGNLIHKYLDLLAKKGKINYSDARGEVLHLAKDILNPEAAQMWAASAEGMLRGFVRSVWPYWMKEYDVFDSEGTVEWEVFPGYIFRARKDLILKSRIDGHLSYREYKTTSSNSPEWIASWSRAVQIHSSMYATRQVEGIEFRDCVVQGFYKGYKDRKTGLNSTIMNRAWVNREYAMTPEYSYEYTRKKGWENFKTFEEFDDLSHWIANMPPQILSEIFPSTAPIFPRDDIAERYFTQQRIRQQEIAEAVFKLRSATTMEEIDLILNTHFQQDFSRCKPQYGYGCEYEPICWSAWIEKDPLSSGLFKVHTYDDVGIEASDG